jgi:phenylalanine-4-hydroxylase
MAQSIQYCAHQADEFGAIHYSKEEDSIWATLYGRQQEAVAQSGCREYLNGLALLNLPSNRIHQLSEVDAVLQATSGWAAAAAAVPSLISLDKFFNLLANRQSPIANRQFPVATFIRSLKELDYLQEPDVFYEIYGHCPLLSNVAFGHFTEHYGKLGLKACKEDRVFLARLYWFTVEFGMLHSANGLRIYGGGILSSPGETEYALHDTSVERREFNVVDVLRTPYRIDIMQPIYYVINDIDSLFDIANTDIIAAVKRAKTLGLFAPTFCKKEKLM